MNRTPHIITLSRYHSGARRLLWYIVLLAPVLPALAQEEPVATDTMTQEGYASGAGLEVVLSNSGFGMGAYYRHGLTPVSSVILETSIGAGKDEREVKFFSYLRSYIPYKANYLLMMPVHAGIQRRLFRNTIENNFRPYLQVTAGPTLGWVSPYFKDCNGNGTLDTDTYPCTDGEEEKRYDAFTAFPKGTFRLGVNGMLALGAYFGTSTRVAQGLRIGYAFNYFSSDIQLLEPGVQGGRQRFFGTPTITLTFGRLH